MKKHYTILAGAAIAAAVAFFLNLSSIIRDRSDEKASVKPGNLPGERANVPTGSTLNSIKGEIARREYHITYDSSHHVLQSPNREHNLRAYYRPGNLTVQNRVDSAGQNFRMELVNEGVYADGALIATAESDAATDNRSDTLTIAHRDFAEEFINNQSGIRQNFIVSRAPAHTQQLSVRLSLHGLLARQQNAGQLIFYSENRGEETDRLTYSDLQCWDANGKPLVAELVLSGKQIEINVDVANAAYPVTIDPIIANGSPANADKTLEINQSYAWLGFSVSTAGDVNGDGYSDVLVGAPKYDNGQADEGAAFLYPGTAGGISLAATVLECNQANAQMGYSVSNAGDINKDGFSDIMVGAPYYDASAANEGAVFIYKGSAGGIVTNNPYVFKLDQAEANLGISVAMAGDVNGDGYSDMLAGAHQFDNNQSNEGIGVVVLGAPNGLGLVTFLECNQPGAMMGFAVAGAGDVDGDGFSDVMAGARLYANGQVLEGAAFIFKGSAGGVVTANPTVIEGNQVDSRFGHALSSAGDVNGDGFSDIAIGAYLYDKGSSNEGVVMIHHGSANGISTVASQTLESDQVEAQFGFSVACAGDVNGDGYADLIAGARYYDKGQVNEGAAFIYQGSKDGLNATPVSVLESNQGDAWMGSAVAPAGDVNGDGFSDVLVGSWAFDHGQKDEGSVFVWYGGGNSFQDRTYNVVYTNQVVSGSGCSVANAGDVNGDGYSDLLIGAYLFDNGQSQEGVAFLYYGGPTGIDLNSSKLLECNQADAAFGKVAAAGDINGDGFGDVLVGAPNFDNVENNEGAVFVFHGSGAGLSGIVATIESNISNAFMGNAVSSAGDTNGDGYDDIVIGASNLSNGQTEEGRFYIFLGSDNGLDKASIKTFESNQADTRLGNAVASAGDVNGDGYDDIVIGAFSSGSTDNGSSFIFYGSTTGIKLDFSTHITGVQPYENLGWAVAGIGDINGDGFSDVAIGSPYHNGDGVVYVYYGSSNGVDNAFISTIIGNQAGTALAFGYSLSSAGDVNGDGFSDLVVGAPYYVDQLNMHFVGEALIYIGSPQGIQPDPIEFDVSKSYNDDYVGFSVSGGGDVNGDGYSDVLVGAPNYDWSYQDNDAAFVHYGNSALGIRNNLRLYNSADLTTPINHTQFPQQNFGAGLFAKSFTGRNKGKLAWETKPLAEAFSKGSNNRITNSTQSTGSQSTYSNLGTTGFELKNVIDKQGSGTKVRVRVKYDPVLALTGQSYGPWRYLPAYLMGNSTSPVPEEVGNDLLEAAGERTAELEDNNALERVVIYPNPATDRLNIHVEAPEQVSSMKILTPAGLMIYQESGFKSSIEVSRFSAGIYYIVITGIDGAHTTRKILIRR
ncbi:Por secretion system C-terminal sorting domain-containing protein [Dyadobacter soli]|uniref:Por secretion system C-terminal sorting domain-containing protein n=1 Tax=Dyadobacter soli TaxID=659014 RepID=A0A1G7W754_9BACT|nr:FG-GAP-like repeat-containing protein [Dyadobacter soli]SDG67010.1 Por secretion system C-terminal sorting domain-containing protein [Dyadobacter soli]